MSAEMGELEIDAEGWLPGVRHHPSVNCDLRPGAELPTLVVVHAISLPPNQFSGDGVLQLFSNTLDGNEHPYYATISHLRVSAHFFIRRDGEIIQFVSCAQRAWHAGVSEWQGRQRCNDFSIGIELEGCDEQEFTGKQYLQLQLLTQALLRRYPINTMAGHSDIAPGRKTDPGPCFDWQRIECALPMLQLASRRC